MGDSPAATDPDLKRVAHIILRIADMERSVSFYRDALGLRVVAETPGFTFLDGGGPMLALNQVEAKHAGAKESLTEVVFECDDIFASWEALSSRGVEFLSEPRCVVRDEHGDLYAAPFRDPDNHVLSITGRSKG